MRRFIFWLAVVLLAGLSLGSAYAQARSGNTIVMHTDGTCTNVGSTLDSPWWVRFTTVGTPTAPGPQDVPCGSGTPANPGLMLIAALPFLLPLSALLFSAQARRNDQRG
jgi:hypothetical protein